MGVESIEYTIEQKHKGRIRNACKKSVSRRQAEFNCDVPTPCADESKLADMIVLYL